MTYLLRMIPTQYVLAQAIEEWVDSLKKSL